MAPKRIYLFGGDKKWNASDWTASDDRVRGGKSESHLEIKSSASVAKFKGTLDIKTLGGAGFASQRTTGDERSWDLSKYDGIELKIVKADSIKYTFTVKDAILAKNPENGRDQASISYEYDFSFDSRILKDDDNIIFIPWSDLKATYRGKAKPDAPKLNLKNVKRFSVLCRSFFGTQEGSFSLSIRSIAAVKKEDRDEDLIDADLHDSDFLDLETGELVNEKSPLISSQPHYDDGRRRYDDARRIVQEDVHHRRRLRVAFVRTLIYSAIVMLMVHAVVVIQRGLTE